MRLGCLWGQPPFLFCRPNETYLQAWSVSHLCETCTHAAVEGFSLCRWLLGMEGEDLVAALFWGLSWAPYHSWLPVSVTFWEIHGLARAFACLKPQQ